MQGHDFLKALMGLFNDNPNSLANKLNKKPNQTQIFNFLSGVVREPRRTTVKPIANHYKVDVEAFYDTAVAKREFARIESKVNESLRGPLLDAPYQQGSGTTAHSYTVVGSATTLKSLRLNVGIGEPSESDASPADVVIPQYDTGGAMGHGLVLEDHQPGIIKSWHVDHEWLRLNVRHHTGTKNLCIVTGFGPSMQPKYNPGDPLLVDSGVNVVETEGIYFFRVGKHGFIKQLQRIPTEDGMVIRAKSLNKDYDPFDITERMDFAVFGKVLTVWRSEQV